MLTLDQFNALAAAGHTHIPVFRQRLADTQTPVSVYARLRGQGDCYLFESVQGGERWGRYSMIGLGSHVRIELRGQVLTVQRDGGLHTSTEDPFAAIEALLTQYRVPDRTLVPDLPGFTGGLVGYFGYDCVRHIEPRLCNPPAHDPIGLPDLWLTLSQQVVVFDTLRDTVSLVVVADAAQADAYAQAVAALDALEARLDAPCTLSHAPFALHPFVSQTGEAQFKAQVARVQAYIRAGDVMQVVPSQRMSADFEGSALQVYRALRHLNPSPYLFLVEGQTQSGAPFALVGSSPEILSRLEQGKVTVRPIAGTRPRGATSEQDQALEQELLADTKEIAEHLMLIDLGRNDVAKVSQIGQVRVTERMAIERYSHVMHIVSNVEGQVKAGTKALDVFKATFPAGTLSGAPKIRAMEIIDELEPVRRGVFGGAVGYLGWGGEMDTAIAIRTGVIHQGKIHVQAGAGVVADSNPDSEWNETLIKAKAVMRAVEMAAHGLQIDAPSAKN